MKKIKKLLRFIKSVLKMFFKQPQQKQDNTIINKLKQVKTMRQERNEFLSKRGYTIKPKTFKKPKRQKPLSDYAQQMAKFLKDKALFKIEVYEDENGKVLRNSKGIPFYKIIR